MKKGVTFSKDAAKRIAKAVKTVERMPHVASPQGTARQVHSVRPRWGVVVSDVVVTPPDEVQPFSVYPCDNEAGDNPAASTVMIHTFTPIPSGTGYTDVQIDLLAGSVIAYIPIGDGSEGIWLSPKYSQYLTLLPHHLLGAYDEQSPDEQVHDDVADYECVPDAVISGNGSAKWDGIDPPVAPPDKRFLTYDPAQTEGQRIVWTEAVVDLADDLPSSVDPDGIAAVGTSAQAAREDHVHEHGYQGVATDSISESVVTDITKKGTNGLTIETTPLDIAADDKGHITTVTAGQPSTYDIDLPQPATAVLAVETDGSFQTGTSSSYARSNHKHWHNVKSATTTTTGALELVKSMSIVDGTLSYTPHTLTIEHDATNHVGITSQAGTPVEVELSGLPAGTQSGDYIIYDGASWGLGTYPAEGAIWVGSGSGGPPTWTLPPTDSAPYTVWFQGSTGTWLFCALEDGDIITVVDGEVVPLSCGADKTVMQSYGTAPAYGYIRAV